MRPHRGPSGSVRSGSPSVRHGGGGGCSSDLRRDCPLGGRLDSFITRLPVRLHLSTYAEPVVARPGVVSARREVRGPPRTMSPVRRTVVPCVTSPISSGPSLRLRWSPSSPPPVPHSPTMLLLPPILM